MLTKSTLRSRVKPVAAVCVLGIAAFAIAGPLTPPTGPVESSYKTLGEVEPRIAINATNTPGGVLFTHYIDKPGSYYLTGNITGEAGKHGIAVSVPGVTIDLNGFELVGVPGSNNGVFFITNGSRNFALRNGRVRNWGASGVDTATYNPHDVEITDVHASNNGAAGLYCAARSRISRCVAANNGTDGINTSARAVIEDCSVWGNGDHGIETAGHCVVRRCEARENVGAGIQVNVFGTVVDCLASENTLQGIDAAAQTVVEHCTANENLSIGILAAAACTIKNNHVSNNNLDGIRVSSQCFVANNSSNNNGVNSALGAGIRATGADNRIEGNNCGFQDIGFDIDVAGNILNRNTATNNTTNWTIVVGNAYGPIVATPAGAAVNGNTAAAALGSTDPNANFTY